MFYFVELWVLEIWGIDKGVGSGFFTSRSKPTRSRKLISAPLRARMDSCLRRNDNSRKILTTEKAQVLGEAASPVGGLGL